MVKGISRQVIVVRSPDPEMFEQAIFILRDGRQGISDDLLIKEANRLIGKCNSGKTKHLFPAGPVWALVGALGTGLIWLLTALV